MLILNDKQTVMPALEREFIFHDWILILFIFGFLILAGLKLYRPQKLRDYAFSIFNKGFIELEGEEKTNDFNLFHIVFMLFSFLSISLTFYFLKAAYFDNEVLSLSEFGVFTAYIMTYLIGKKILELLISYFLDIKEILKYFFSFKRGYLYAISLGFFFLNFLFFYGFQNKDILLIAVISFITLRFVLILLNNKNLIIKELFYFILYLCTFEIAPLMILYKLIIN